MKYDALIKILRRDNPIAKYTEMGSLNRKTGKRNYYTVTRNLVRDTFSCDCPAGQFRRYNQCKHVTNLRAKILV